VGSWYVLLEILAEAKPDQNQSQPDPDTHQPQNLEAVEIQNRAMEGPGRSQWRLKVKPCIEGLQTSGRRMA
jgi:hypothetical protein